MEDSKKAPETDQLSEDQLKEVAGGKGNVHAQRLEHLDNQTKSVDNVQETRLDHLDNQTK